VRLARGLSSLSHVDAQGMPTMVDVGAKVSGGFALMSRASGCPYVGQAIWILWRV
jgi:hypothetical protein